MIEELGEFLERYGWNHEDAWEVHDAYEFRDPLFAKAVKVIEWMNDETHDYTGEMKDCIDQWLWESGEKALPKMRIMKR